MKKLTFLVFVGLFSLVACGKKQSQDQEAKGRTLASVESPEETLDIPISAKKFILNQPQRAKADLDIRHYSAILPKDIYQRMLKLARSVDDRGFSVERNANEMILNNGVQNFKLSFSGPADDLKLVFDGNTYNFSKEGTLEDLVKKLEKDIQGTQTSSHNVLPFFKVCSLLGVLGMSQDSMATNWFFVGGMAILGVAIAYAAYKFGKSIQKTKHTVNTNSSVSLDKGSQDSLNNLSDALKNANLDVNVDTNHDVNIGVDTDSVKDAVEERAEEATGLF